MTRNVGTILALVLAGILFAPTKAGATTYTYTATFDPTTESCPGSSPGGDCFLVLTAWNPVYPPNGAGPILEAGDVVNVDVTFTTPFTVDGGTGVSNIFVAVLDSNYYDCLGLGTCTTPQPLDCANSTETILGENSGGPTITTGINTCQPGFYVAAAGIAGPNPGFSVTGFDGTLDITNGDAFPIAAVAIESFVVNTPEPGTIVLTLVGLGLLFALRKRFSPSIGKAA